MREDILNPTSPNRYATGADARWFGASVLLSAAACWLALHARWDLARIDAWYRGQGDLDLPDAIAINSGLLFTVMAYTILIGFFQFVAAGVFVRGLRGLVG